MKKYSCQIQNVEEIEPIAKEIINYEQQNLISIISQTKYEEGRKVKSNYECNQQILRKEQPDGSITLVWLLHNLFVGADNFFNKNDPNWIKHSIKSGSFESIDGMNWMLSLIPGVPS